MLYDKKWDKEVKTDPFTVPGLIAWLEKQPARKVYCYYENGHCLLAQYVASLGYTEINLNPDYFWHSAGKQELPYVLNYIAIREPWMFGAALKRARAELPAHD